MSITLLIFLILMLAFAAIEYYRLTPNTRFYEPPRRGKPIHAFIGRLIGDAGWLILILSIVKVIMWVV